MRENFRQYAKYYDLLNRDKPYAQEASMSGHVCIAPAQASQRYWSLAREPAAMDAS